RHNVKVLIGFVMSGDRTVYAATKLAGAKLVVAERNAPEMYSFRYRPFQRWLTFRLLGLADRITVQLESFTAGYPRRLHNRMVAIPNPVPSPHSFARPNVADASGRLTVLAISRLDPVQKRVGYLLAAFARIAQRFPDWRLRIIGDGPEKAALLRRIDDFGLASRVRIEPSTPDVFDAYVQSHLFAIPSLWEGFPNALAEAMSHGLPAVGFAQAAGVSELIGSDGGWLAVGLNDEVALAAALASAMADGEERLRRGRRATQRMSQFAPDQQFDCWETLLRSLTGNGMR
ncbi:MAG: glycosyltransferase, partial [Planctomycetales bacterium]|nr:glycosyltransferase [Planctomycetales bacterium]